MTNNESNKNDFLLFEGFIAYLKRQGFVVGIDTHLRLQHLLNKIGGDYSKSELKHLLSPIFVTNPKQQTLFYQAFDHYFNQFENIPLSSNTDENPSNQQQNTPPPSPPDILPQKRKYWLIGLLTFALVVVAIGFLQQWELNEWQQEYSDRIREVIAINEQGTPDSNSVSLLPDNTSNSSNDSNAIELDKTGKISLQLKPPIKEDIANLKAKWYERLGWWLQLLKWAILAGIFIGFVVYQVYRRHKKQALLQRERYQAPPDYWNPLQVVDTPKKLYRSTSFYRTAKEMRVRVKGDYQVLNIDKSITATLESGGYLNFKYDNSTRPVEYLVLIEEQTPKDHQARFFDRLTEELAQQDVYIERYFYQNDPRHCWKVEYQVETNLQELAVTFPNHQLLIMGDGESFLDPLNERILAWTEQFSAWKIRSLITAKPTTDWGYTEIQLSKVFHVSHFLNTAVLNEQLNSASVFRLLASESKLASEKGGTIHYSEKNIRKQLEHHLADSLPPIESLNDVAALRQYFDPKTYQLLCACAVYPELHWDFTLHLAKKTLPNSSAEQGTLFEELSPNDTFNLFVLARLPWFREGYIPDDTRTALIKDLDPAIEQLTRQAIIQLLKQNPPPHNSYAYDEYAMNLAVNEWELAEGKIDKKKRAQALAELMDRDRLLQFVRIKYQYSLDKIKNAFAVPELVRENLFQNGIPLLGFKNYVSAAIVFLLLALIGGLVDIPESESLVELDGDYFYLYSKRDTARFYHFKAQLEEDPVIQQAFLDTALAIDTLYAKAHYNLALTYHDALVGDGSEADSLLLGRAIGGFSKTSKVYDIVEDGLLMTLEEDIELLQFGIGDTCFATVGSDYIIRLYNLEGELLEEFVGHRDKVTSVNFSEYYSWIITSSLDGSVRIWDLDGTELYVYSQPYQFYTYACFVPNSPNRILVTYMGEEGNLELSTLAELEIAEAANASYSFGGKKDISYISIGVKYPDFSKDGQDVLYPAKNQIVWKKLATGEQVQDFNLSTTAIGGFFALDDLLQITLEDEGGLVIHDEKGAMHTTQLDFTPFVVGLSDNQKYLFIGDKKTGEIKVFRPKLTWNGIENWGLVKKALQNDPILREQSISSNSPTSSNSSPSEAVEYDFRFLNHTLGAYTNSVNKVAFSPSGQYTLFAQERDLLLSKADFQSIAYALYNLGVIQYQQQNYAQAANLFGQAHAHSQFDPSILYARAISNLYMDSLELGLKDVATVMKLDSQYFQFNLAILPLLQDLYLKSEGALQEEVLKTLESLGIDIVELQEMAMQQRFKQRFGEEWKGVYLLSTKFDNDKKWRSFDRLIIGADGTVRFHQDTLQNITYLPTTVDYMGFLQWTATNSNKSEATFQLRRSRYGDYKKVEWELNRKSINTFNFFEFQNQLLDQQFEGLRGKVLRGNMVLEEETKRQVRGWTFDSTPSLLQSFYDDDTPAPNFNTHDFAYISEPNQYGLMRIQNEKGLWGLMTLKEQILIPPYYKGIGIFSDGLAGVQKDQKIGFINPEGEVVIKLQYDEVTLFKNGRATVKVDGKTFEIDKRGNKLEELVVQKPAKPTSNTPLTPNEQKSLPEIGQFEQVDAPQDTRQKLLAPAGMVYVEGGTFQMGSNDGEDDERPVHKVLLNSYYIDKHEVTNAQYAEFLNSYGSDVVQDKQYYGEQMVYENQWGLSLQKGRWSVRKGYENHPIIDVTWYGANEYARFYNKRLPTEAEWEYTAIGGQESRNFDYSGSNDINSVAWYNSNARNQTHKVMTKRPNELGIFDMSGNVREWCADFYNSYYSSKGVITNPTGPKGGNARVIRGGSWQLEASSSRSANRSVNPPTSYKNYIGFRCVKGFNSKKRY